MAVGRKVLFGCAVIRSEAETAWYIHKGCIWQAVFFMRRGAQRKNRRAGFAAVAACAPRGEQGKKPPLLDS